MFLENLTPAEKPALLDLARHLADADGRVEPSEHDLITRMASEMGIDIPATPPGPIEQLIPCFETRRAKLIAMFELIGLGYADRHMGAAEVAIAADIARRFDFTVEVVDQIDDLVQDHLAVAQRTFEFFQQQA